MLLLALLTAQTAGAQEDLTGFLTVSSSGTASAYFAYSDHFYRVDWTGINTTQTTSVKLTYNPTYGRLRAQRNGNTSSFITLAANADASAHWNTSHITGLTPGQSSDGYTSYTNLSANAVTKCAKVCTVTCMAANTPTWNWSADYSTCTATFTCTAPPSLTTTVNATVTTSGSTATASATFNGTNYSDTTIDPAHFSQLGNTYTIHTATGWDVFCDMLAESDKGIFTGKTVKLGADITVSRIAGADYHDFTGTFDGDGHTLTFNYTTTENYAAPFRNVESGCVIENLHVSGTINTSAMFAAGLVGNQYGAVTIRNCRVSVTIQSTVISAASGDGKLYAVTLSGRTLYKDGSWNTLCLPFSVGDPDASTGHWFDDTPLEGATVMTLANSPGSSTGFDSNTGVLSLYFVEANQIEAGVPYIVKWPEVGSNLVNPVFESVTIENEVPADNSIIINDGTVSFTGIYSPASLFTTEHTNYYLGADNKLYYPSRENFQLRAFRCYFHLNDPSLSVKGFVLDFDDDATGIDAIDHSSLTIDHSIYNLAGQRLNKAQKGINIINGKKILK